MNSRKSQISIFIIIALILISLILYLFFIYRNIIIKKPTEKFLSIKNLLEDKISYSIGNALLFVGSQGGYSDVPSERINFRFNSIPLYYFNGRKIPSIGQVNEEISKEINKRVKEIEMNFSGMEVVEKELDVDVQDFINVSFYITIKKGEKINNLRINKLYKNPFYKMLNVSEAIVGAPSFKPYQIDLKQLLRIQNEYIVEINPIIYDEDTIIYRIVDNQTRILNSSFEFYFAVKNE